MKRKILWISMLLCLVACGNDCDNENEVEFTTGDPFSGYVWYYTIENGDDEHTISMGGGLEMLNPHCVSDTITTTHEFNVCSFVWIIKRESAYYDYDYVYVQDTIHIHMGKEPNHTVKNFTVKYEQE